MTNPARRLHEVLVALTSGKGVSNMWINAIGGEAVRTVDFARRHAEVVRLLGDTIALIDGLPEHAQRRYSRYAGAWWEAVVLYRMPWGSGAGAEMGQLLTDPDLDMLESAADLIDAHYAGTLDAPAGTLDLNVIRGHCASWRELIDQATELPAELRRSLMADLRDVEWLIENAYLVGESRVGTAAASFLGRATTVEQRLAPSRREKWAAGAVGFAHSLALFSGVYDAGQIALDQGQHMVHAITQAGDTQPAAPGVPAVDPEAPDTA